MSDDVEKNEQEEAVDAGSQVNQSSGDKPGAITAFGVLHIIFGALGIIGGIIGVAGSAVGSAVTRGAGIDTGGFMAGVVVFAVLGLLVSILLLVAGIVLLGQKKKALQVSLAFVISSLALRVLNIVFGLAIGFHVGWFFTIIGLAYPIVVLLVLVTNKNVKAYLEAKNA